jgi:hypothetical protein
MSSDERALPGIKRKASISLVIFQVPTRARFPVPSILLTFSSQHLEQVIFPWFPCDSQLAERLLDDRIGLVPNTKLCGRGKGRGGMTILLG